MDADEQHEEAESLEAIYGEDLERDEQAAYRVRRARHCRCTPPVQQVTTCCSRNAANGLKPQPGTVCCSHSLLQMTLLLQVYLPSRSCEHAAVLRVLLPPRYPSAAGPVMELEAEGIAEQQLAAAVQHMENMFCPGMIAVPMGPSPSL